MNGNGEDPELKPKRIILDAMAVAGAIGPTAEPAAVPDALIPNGEPGAMSPLEESDAVDAASIDGWTSSVTQRMTEAMGGIPASTDTVIIYNDQAARSRPMFSDRYPTYDVDTDDDTENDALRINTTNVVLISGVEEFPSAARQTGVEFDANTNYAGMLDGASGTFTCEAANCTLDTDVDGKLSSVSDGNWYFIPSEEATVDPNDYLRFGFWLNESTDDEGGPAYTVAAIYGGSADPASANLNSGCGWHRKLFRVGHRHLHEEDVCRKRRSYSSGGRPVYRRCQPHRELHGR